MNNLRGLWRGKLKYNVKPYKKGEWVEGHFTRLDDNSAAIIPHIYGYGEVEVEEDTLGECTGSFDKNGKNVFEGDIVEYKGIRYKIEYLEKYIRFSANKTGTVFAVFDLKQSEIIGNIHDNPELLSGK